MAVNETPGTITVGQICLGCALLITRQCPYKNHLRTQVTQFQGDIRGKCTYYISAVEAKGERDMIKEANMIKESELNVSLYKKIFALNENQRNKLFDYWEHIFPKEYASDMVTDDNESKQHGLKTKNIKKKGKK